MSPISIDQSINTATVSLEMEGFTVDPAHKELCRKLLAGDISLTEYLALVTPEEVV